MRLPAVISHSGDDQIYHVYVPGVFNIICVVDNCVDSSENL